MLNLIAQANSEVAQAQILVEEFLAMIRTLQGNNLDPWLERVKATRIKELQQFAHGLERDKAAVMAGLTLPYSTGSGEGHINRLKLRHRDKAMVKQGLRICLEGSLLLKVVRRLQYQEGRFMLRF